MKIKKQPVLKIFSENRILAYTFPLILGIGYRVSFRHIHTCVKNMHKEHVNQHEEHASRNNTTMSGGDQAGLLWLLLVIKTPSERHTLYLSEIDSNAYT